MSDTITLAPPDPESPVLDLLRRDRIPHIWCPGCGIGTTVNCFTRALVASKINLEKTAIVSGIGCTGRVAGYINLDSFHTTHGRAIPFATGMKLANPDLTVCVYSGDGDLFSIGGNHFVHAARRNMDLKIFCVNNFTYGMTGGQLAPTTLIGQPTSTSPYGRTAFMGQPMRMAETIAQLDGPIYVERVALFDNKQRLKAEKAIKKALQLQVENKGFAFVEVLAECPTHLKMTPEESEKWVKEKMLPIFPLGVKKDVPGRDWSPELVHPRFDAQELLKVVDAHGEGAPRFMTGFPRQVFGSDVAMKLAGSGGDGAQTAAMLLCRAAINEGFDATHIPSYGPESRGGTSYADVHMAEDEVLSPAAPHPHVLVAFNAPSLAKFGPMVAPGGVIVYDSSVIHELPRLEEGVRAHGVPFTTIAKDLGKLVVKNIVALGALQAATGLLHGESILAAVREALHEKCALIPLNEQAFAWGVKAVKEEPWPASTSSR